MTLPGRALLAALIVAGSSCGGRPVSTGAGGSGGSASGAGGGGGAGAGGGGGVVNTSDAGRDALDGSDAPDTQSGVSYLGCSYVGAIDRIVVAKRDPSRDLCFNVVLDFPGQPPSGLSLPASFGLERAGAAPANLCPSRGAITAAAASATGTITSAGGDAGVAGHPSHVNVDVMLTFAAMANEALSAQDVDVQGACPGPVCTAGADQTCNDNPALSSIHGHCTDIGTCVCAIGAGLNPSTGRCL